MRRYSLRFDITIGLIKEQLVHFFSARRPCSNLPFPVRSGGVFVAGSLAWGMVAGGFLPDRYDVIGAIICVAGVAVIMYAPRSGAV